MSEKKAETEQPLIDAKGRRLDGRKLDDLRPIHLEIGNLSRADGSAYIEHGRNKIVAAVYGPRELHPRHLAQSDRALLRVNYRMATFSVSDRKRPAPTRREHEISMVLRQALEPMLFLKNYPRAVVDVFVLVLEADGGSRCASATVASLALADAGIPMRGLVAGCAAGKIAGKVALDLSDLEDKVGEADVPLAMAPNRGEITLLQMDGKLTPSELAKAVRLAEEGIHQIQEMQRAVLSEKYVKIREQVSAANKTPPEKEEKPTKEPKTKKKRTKKKKTKESEKKSKAKKTSKSTKKTGKKSATKK